MHIQHLNINEEFISLFHKPLLDFLAGVSKHLPILLFSSEMLKNPYLNFRLNVSDDLAIFVGKGSSEAHLFLPFEPFSFNMRKGIILHTFSELMPFIIDNLKEEKRLGLDFSKTTLSFLSRLKARLGESLVLINVSEIMNGYFSLKEEKEVELCKEACSLTDEVFELFVDEIKKGAIRSEYDAWAFIKKTAKKLSAELAFPPIIANAEHSSYIHYSTYSRKPFRKGFLLVDFGLKYEGFCADMTRMLYLGDPSEEEKALFEFVRRLKNRCVEKAGEVSSLDELERFAMRTIENKGFELLHAIGHGIGAFVHEPLYLFPSLRKMDVKKANLLAVEPGIYLKGRFGIRLEDTVLLGKEVEPITRSRDELVVVH